MVRIVAGSKERRFLATPDFTKYRLCQNGTMLTADQKKVFMQRVNELQQGPCLLIYRGDRRRAVLRRYGLNEYDLPQPFNDMLFLIGTKGRYFWENISQSINSANRSVGVAEVTDKVFRSIFDMVANILQSGRFNQGVQDRIGIFKHQQVTVTQFFTTPKNKAELVAKVKGLPENEKVTIRDYYLTLLHHLDKSEYYPVSFLMSATKSFSVACSFIREAQMSQDEIIFFGWVPKGSKAILSTYRYSVPQKENVVIKAGLPVYTQSFFPRQQEISLKGGLLPHYLLGYLYTREGQLNFEVNPNLFGITSDNWITDGLPVDQTEFHAKIKRTSFERFFLLNEETGLYTEG